MAKEDYEHIDTVVHTALAVAGIYVGWRCLKRWAWNVHEKQEAQVRADRRIKEQEAFNRQMKASGENIAALRLQIENIGKEFEKPKNTEEES